MCTKHKYINLLFSNDVYKDSFPFFSSFVLILLLCLVFALCRHQIDKKAKNVCGQAIHLSEQKHLLFITQKNLSATRAIFVVCTSLKYILKKIISEGYLAYTLLVDFMCCRCKMQPKSQGLGISLSFKILT